MSRNTVKLAKTMHRDLSLYTLAASAAGVSMLALAQPTETQIVYTPAHEVIGRNGTLPIDLNHDGITDVTIREIPWTAFGDGRYPGNSLQAKPGAGGGIKICSQSKFAAAVARGAQIGGSSPFRSRVEVIFHATSSGVIYGGCTWSEDTTNGFLGIRFRIGAETHYGWARMDIRIRPPKSGFSLLLTGYAYETQPDTAIRAGDTGQNDSKAPSNKMSTPPQLEAKERSTLGALALGAAAVSRRPHEPR
jgi:hypothetical protein